MVNGVLTSKEVVAITACFSIGAAALVSLGWIASTQKIPTRLNIGSDGLEFRVGGSEAKNRLLKPVAPSSEVPGCLTIPLADKSGDESL